MKLRTAFKSFSYQTGAMDMFHRVRNRESLTVVMFHRVLPAAEMHKREADPVWTVTPEFLGQGVSFLRRNYTIVGLEDVLLSRAGERPLPARSALITFDDGWRDNLEWALPVLRGIPWTLFVATDALSGPHCWWQEVLSWAVRSGFASYDELWRKAGDDNAPTYAEKRDIGLSTLLLRYGCLPDERRRSALAACTAALCPRYGTPQMLSLDELRLLQNAGVSIGAHGASHLPLPEIADPASDLQRARDWLSPVSRTAAMSFPHGRYDAAVANVARGFGYRLLFTSDPVLNRCPMGWLQSDVVGRIVLGASISVDQSPPRAPQLAAWLYLRRRHALAA